MWIALGIVAVLFWGITHPVIIRSGRNSDQTDAMHNARQIGLALFDFETEYGSFPDETTAAKIRQKTGTRGIDGVINRRGQSIDGGTSP